MQLLKKRKKAPERRRELRDQMWPGAEKLVWTRHTDDGYSTVPRTVPLVMTLIDLLESKVDASRVYAELWSRVHDEGFIEMVDEAEHAYAAGYVTQRGQRSWRERMQVLQDLGFIQTKKKGGWRYGYVLLMHPHDVVETLRKTRTDVPEEWVNLYLQRLSQIGARSGKAAVAPVTPVKVAVKVKA
jgi:hypothetical protein